MLVSQRLRDIVNMQNLVEKEALIRSYYETEASNHRAGMQLVGAGAVAGAFGVILTFVQVVSDRGSGKSSLEASEVAALVAAMVLVLGLVILGVLLAFRMRRTPDNLIDTMVDLASRLPGRAADRS